MQRREFMRVVAATGAVGFLIPGPASAFYDPKLGEPHADLPSMSGVRDLLVLPAPPTTLEFEPPVPPVFSFEKLAKAHGLKFHASKHPHEPMWDKLETTPVVIVRASQPDCLSILEAELFKLYLQVDSFLQDSWVNWKHLSAPTVTCDSIYELGDPEPVAYRLNVWVHVTTAILGEETMSALMASARAVAANAGVDDVDDYAQLLKDQAHVVDEFLEHAGKPDEECPANPDPTASPEAQKAWEDAHSLKCFANQATPHHKKQIAHQIKRQKRRSHKPVTEAEAERLADAVVNQAVSGDQASVAASLLESRGQQ